MRRPLIQLMILMLLATAVLAAGTTTAPSAKKAATTTQPRDVAPVRHTSDYYDVVVQRNIFVRHGQTTTNYSRREVLAPTNFRPSIPSSAWVLTGIAITDVGRVAFFENAQTGVATRLKTGQAVAGGVIKSIEPEGVTIAYESGSRKIAVGSQTDGSEASTTMPGSASSSTQPAGDGTSAPGATPAENSLLERMRARRAQEK